MPLQNGVELSKVIEHFLMLPQETETENKDPPIQNVCFFLVQEELPFRLVRRSLLRNVIGGTDDKKKKRQCSRSRKYSIPYNSQRNY